MLGNWDPPQSLCERSLTPEWYDRVPATSPTVSLEPNPARSTAAQPATAARAVREKARRDRLNDMCAVGLTCLGDIYLPLA